MQVLPQCGHAVHEDSPDKVDIQSNLPMWSPLLCSHLYLKITFPTDSIYNGNPHPCIV